MSEKNLEDLVARVIRWATEGEPRCPHDPPGTHYLRQTRPLACRKCLLGEPAESAESLAATLATERDLRQVAEEHVTQLLEAIRTGAIPKIGAAHILDACRNAAALRAMADLSPEENG